MKKRRKKKGVNVAAYVLLVTMSVLILTTAAFYLGRPQSQDLDQERKPAKDYFRVFEPTVDMAKPLNPPDNTQWIIYGISFKLQPIHGDAHNVIVRSWAMADPEEVGDIPEGEFEYVSIEAPYGYYGEMNEDGKVPITISIYSEEAEGEITVYF